jgi:hypothetical protein
MYDESVRWSDDGATVGHEDLDLKAIEPQKIRGDLQVDWQAGGVATTPPGMWHAHFNETDQPPHLIPVQDAGLQTYLRSLDIKFTQRRDLVVG